MASLIGCAHLESTWLAAWHINDKRGPILSGSCRRRRRRRVGFRGVSGEARGSGWGPGGGGRVSFGFGSFRRGIVSSPTGNVIGRRGILRSWSSLLPFLSLFSRFLFVFSCSPYSSLPFFLSPRLSPPFVYSSLLSSRSVPLPYPPLHSIALHSTPLYFIPLLSSPSLHLALFFFLFAFSSSRSSSCLSSGSPLDRRIVQGILQG